MQHPPSLHHAGAPAVLRSAAEQKDIVIDDPQPAAIDLCAMWRGTTDIALRLGIVDTVSVDPLNRKVRRGT